MYAIAAGWTARYARMAAGDERTVGGVIPSK